MTVLMTSATVIPEHPDVLAIKREDGMTLHYLNKDGALYPGRLWRGIGPRGEGIVFFMPLPDGMPTILSVDSPMHRVIDSEDVKGIIDAVEQLGDEAPLPLKRLWSDLIK